ncbi:UNVERIFIED_CONTAM: hypothetical protein PYX00_004101 [Menopon gallinae]|uniref:Condensin-2 complex subunit H2 n=1 Tax=Menopon gallinae TaxID=328185 RepID=A0AAW2I2X9_9NEOP
MTSASQFSLEEENFYKDIQDLVKKGSQNEKELSTFLQRYMDLLARADLDDETFIINFTKAALILEASTKVYGTKVDRLWITLEQVLEALKVNGKNENNKKKGDNEEDVDDVDGEVPADDMEPHKKLPNPKRRKKLGDGLSSPDDFLEIDNISGLLGKNMNETGNSSEVKIKFHEEIPNLFIRNKTDRKRVDVCLVQSTDDRDDSRLRDWIVSEDNMLVKEIYIAQSLDRCELSITGIGGESFPVVRENNFDSNSVCNSDFETHDNEPVDAEPMEVDAVPDDSNNNNVENVPDTALQDQTVEKLGEEKYMSTENRDKVVEAFNRSEEVDVGKFPNIFLRRLEDCLVDVNEVLWNSTRFQDVIPSRKMRVKKTNKTPCQLCCKKQGHVKKGKRCHMFDKNPCLDSYFSPLVQPTVSEPPFGILPDEEIYNAFKIETKLIEQLGKVDKSKNIYEAHHLEDNQDEETNFLGFDGFESYLMRQTVFDECDVAEDNVSEAEDDFENVDVPEPEEDIGLPLPTIDDRSSALEDAQIEYPTISDAEVRSQEVAKSRFERNKELGMKIAEWHASLVQKIELSQKRGALNVDLLAGKVLKSFPETNSGDKPVISFRDLVKGQPRRDIPRYFFACLQLTNEGNIDILKSSSAPLTTDCMLIKQLRVTRVRHELDEYTTNSTSPKKVDKSRSLSLSSNSPSTRKRHSYSISSTDSIQDEPVKKKKAKKPSDRKSFAKEKTEFRRKI